MKIIIEDKNRDFNTKIIWTRIYIESDDGYKKTTILVAVLRLYYMDYPGVKKVEDFPFDQWIKDVAGKWEKLGDQIFEHSVNYDVYANTVEGRQNGFNFLKNKITP